MAITAIILLGAFGFPMPVPLAGLLAAAGVFAAYGQLCVALLIALAAGGAVLGDTLGYATGRFGMRVFLRRSMVPDSPTSPSAGWPRRLVAKMLASRVVTRAVEWSGRRLSGAGVWPF